MKTLYLLLITLLFAAPAWGQTRTTAATDVLYKTTGEALNGKVIRVTDTSVSFVYTGEAAEYVINRADIQKIVHASGRVETFGAASAAPSRQPDPVSMTASPADHHNKIAILPFSFLIERQAGAPEMGYQAQNDAYSFLIKHTAGYTILDTRSTNAVLLKAGVTRDKMMAYTMKEICDMLGVEYVLDGTVTLTKGYQTSSSSSSADAKVKRDGDQVKGVNASTYNYSDSAQRYETSVSLNIYMDNNASIYNQSHKAFLTSTDADYKSPLEYLLKRSPLYRN